MRIGLIGWYGHSNAGDERILYCLRRFFDGHDLLVTSSFGDASARIEELNSCDFVILGGGGLILRGTGQFAAIVERLKPRFGCVGISVEARHADNVRIIQVLKARAEFILVRDARSRELLDCHFKTIVGPDLTFLYPFEVAAPVESDVCGVNLRPWRFWPGEHNGAFDRLMRRLNHGATDLERLYPFAKWNQEKVVNILRRSFKTVSPISLYLEDGVKNDRDVLSTFFPEAPAEFAPEHFHACRYIVGMRLHALIFACQTAIPFLSLSYQPKNEEFCKALGMPGLSLDIFRPALLAEAIDNLKSEYARIRLGLLDIRAEYRQEIRAVMTAIRRLVTRVGQEC